MVALGEDALAWARRADRVVEPAGRCLVPGFRDGHVHPLGGGEVLAGPPIRDVAGLEELLDRLGAWARAHPEPPVVEAAGYDPTFAPGGHFDATWLDRAVPDRPALVWSTDHHAVWANSAALAAYTSGGAWQAFEEEVAGTIAVGKRADLALLGADLPALDPAELAGVPVLGTWLAGVPVFGG